MATTEPTDSRKRTVLITGAAGRVGAVLRRGLADTYHLRLFDLVPMPDEPTAIRGDITVLDDLVRAMDGVDAVVHLAAQASDGDFYSETVPRNIIGAYHLFEAARQTGVRRVVFASTYHTVEGYGPFVKRRPALDYDETLTGAQFPLSATVPPRPDSMYAVSKVFGETLAQYYADFHGVSTVCLRLGAVGPKRPPSLANPRTWSSWLAPDDLCRLVRCAVEAQNVGCAIVYGISRNTRRIYDLEPGRALIGYDPQDDSELHLRQWYREGVVPPAPLHLAYADRLPELLTPPGHTALVWVGQAGFFIKTAGTSLYMDPFVTVWHDSLQLPLLKPAELRADLILITHHHRDHLDRHALPVAAAAWPTLRFAGPPSCCERLASLGIAQERLVPLRAGERIQSGDAEIMAMPARHQENAPDSVGYVLRTSGGCIYHTGDTEYDPVLLDARRLAPDLLIVPINGRGGNMTAEQAAQLCADLSAPFVIPMHYGMLQPQAGLVERFLLTLSQAAPTAKPAVMEYGAILYLPLAGPGGTNE